MRKSTATACFLVVLLAATADAQIYVRESAMTPWAGVAEPVLAFPGSEIGAAVRDLPPAEARGQWLWHGVVVAQVTPDSPASRAGLRKGDIIIELDYVYVADARHCARIIRDTPPGRPVVTTVVRDGVLTTFDLIPEMPPDGSSRWP
jgi:membrane-associated protease RseP (regulator of RpoE activity)